MEFKTKSKKRSIKIFRNDKLKIMAIKEKNETGKKRIIDLSGPEGNAFALIGTANRWGTQMGVNLKKMNDELTSGDYENLIQVFDKYFGKICDLER